MTSRWLAGAFVATLTLLPHGSARAADAGCWNLVYHAMERSAASRHVPFISYSERERILLDGHRFEFADATITYRDDGVAYIDDDRWDHPFVSRWLEPGPPVLGPYGAAERASWLAYAAPLSGLPVIADASTGQRNECMDLGESTIDGRAYARLVFPDARSDEPSMKTIWIDRNDFEIRRLITSAWIEFATPENGVVHDLANFTVDFIPVDDVDVVKNIRWTYSYKVFDQRSTLEAEYSFGSYHFGTTAPNDAMFAGR